MKSVKPGRGPSFMGGIMSIFVSLFGVLWMIIAVKMGAGIFSLFGLIFVAVAITMAIFNFKNALGKNRYSHFDITDSHEEQDPFDEIIKNKNSEDYSKTGQKQEKKFCPYCGNHIEAGYAYCVFCGNKLNE